LSVSVMFSVSVMTEPFLTVGFCRSGIFAGVRFCRNDKYVLHVSFSARF
jgi:hypothetical protein